MSRGERGGKPSVSKYIFRIYRKVDTIDGSTLTFVSASGFIPGMVKKIYVTGTTATNIIALK